MLWATGFRYCACHEQSVACRPGTSLDELQAQPGTLLHRHRDHVHIVTDPVASNLSSTLVRSELAQVCCVLLELVVLPSSS